MNYSCQKIIICRWVVQKSIQQVIKRVTIHIGRNSTVVNLMAWQTGCSKNINRLSCNRVSTGHRLVVQRRCYVMKPIDISTQGYEQAVRIISTGYPVESGIETGHQLVVQRRYPRLSRSVYQRTMCFSNANETIVTN